jgi:formylglycine-generating enzyme required for sulfatase activity
MKSLLIGMALLLLAGSAFAAPPATQPTLTVEIPKTTVSFTLVKIPAGSVEVPAMKGDGRGQVVQIKPFWIGQTEVTWDLYDVWVNKLDLPEKDRIYSDDVKTHPSKPYGLADHGFGHDGFAAIGIHSNGAECFCQWLSRKTGHKYRLPTEAEWIYACRAGSAGEPFNDLSHLKSMAWIKENSEDDAGDPAAHAVATRQPNAWGLYDMLGNAAEWVIAADGTPLTKGGSFRDGPKIVNSTSRTPFNPNWQMTDPEAPKSRWWLRDGWHVGFRVVREDF